MELLLLAVLLALLGGAVWLVRDTRAGRQQVGVAGRPATPTSRLQRLWWPPADEPVPRERWSALPPR